MNHRDDASFEPNPEARAHYLLELEAQLRSKEERLKEEIERIKKQAQELPKLEQKLRETAEKLESAYKERMEIENRDKKPVPSPGYGSH